MSNFFPDIYQKNIYTINYQKLWDSGIRCLLFDLDNTCVPYKEKKSTKELKELFNNLSSLGFKIIIFSNSPKRRLKRFSDLGIEFNSFSMKPLSHNFYKILKKYGYDKSEVIIIGDQIFTDVYGGNKVGITTCLVDPLTNVDMMATKLTRLLENRKINMLGKARGFKRGKYYD